MTPAYNGYINNRQMQTKRGNFLPHMLGKLRYPDVEYEESMTLDVGGVHMELKHFKGETDDCTITWLPASKVLFTGDFWIWAMPNAGNPQKVQRFPREWSACFKAMADLGAESVFPGHGPPILGAENIRRAFLETASFLDGIIDPCLRLINEGRTLNYLQTNVKKPEVDPVRQVFLQQNYDDWRYVIYTDWLYTGYI
jgi:glyoxylase-like metal-dependent hydrolase (beta-lactamase superfamily II)